MIFKFLKFVVVGFSGLIIDFAITYLFKDIFKVNKYLSNSIGFTLAASSNYLLNRLWTFSSDNPNIGTEYASFLIISIFGLGINNLFLYLFQKKTKFYLAKLLAIVVTTIWNFLANYFITFSL